MKTMRLTQLPLVVLILALAGCSWLQSSLPGRRPDVPVTTPTEVDAKAAEALATPRAPAQPPAPLPPPEPEATDDDNATIALSRPANIDVSLAPSRLPAGQVLSQPTIQVNGEYITVSDVLQLSRERLSELPPGISDELFRRQAAKIIDEETQRNIVDRLTYAQAQRRMEEPMSQHIDSEVAETLRLMVAKAGGSRQRLQRQLIDQGTTLDWVLENHRRQMVITAFLQQKFQSSVHVTPSEMWAYYQQHGDEFATPAKVQMQIIAAPLARFLPEESRGLKPTPQERADALAKARQAIEQAQRQVKDGADFEQVARELSKGPRASAGGTWPLMPKGSFRVKEVEDAAFRLQQGQVSDIISTDDGFYIVKAYKVEKAQTQPFETAQREIERKLRQQKYRQASNEYFQQLLKDAVVRQSDSFVEAAVSEAISNRKD